MHRIFSLFLFVLVFQFSHAQKRVVITIDDVPNMVDYLRNGYISPLLETIDFLKIPVTIFINEGNIYKTDAVVQNFTLLTEWIKSDFVSPGNHTFNHSRFSDVGIRNFEGDILKGEAITRAIAAKEKKELLYFRFPFNDLGNDSFHHDSITNYLNSHNYKIAPFTIESADWMCNFLYEQYEKSGKYENAERVANTYIDYTLLLFDHFENLSEELFQRPIDHIYLCHDNTINAAFLPVLVRKLKSKNYSFISLDEALKDDAYQLEDFYKGKWGFSWMYRWIEDIDKRQAWMMKEPAMDKVYKEYKEVNKSK